MDISTIDGTGTQPTVEDLAGIVHAAIDTALRALEEVTPHVDALEAHPDEPSVYEIREGLHKATEALTDAAGYADKGYRE
ncbi:hypothetical protein D7D52_35950 [Nocardia yunnanensis]|uniref:Uncharacterized protein n=1 Tax=Nocardia yunnanensis TaxID=2382165 RepID=A0A386ZMD3_9NOCA|nr:hypothetical protein [Nocardia yunnanensis]AYF78334.1 hypothetical protein D7D52_35950 [Nocardia yunnanensis]